MTNWITYTGDNLNIKLNDLISKYIVEEIGSCLSTFFNFDTKKRPQRTTLIKDKLSKLGDTELLNKEKFKVYSNGLSSDLRQENGGKFKNREWLYDLHWYTEDTEPYLPIRLPLVVECEWDPERKGDIKKVPFGGIKYDFQKLLVANSELRLMIFIIKKDNDLHELDLYFDKAIDTCQHIGIDSKFLFIAFDEKIKSFYYTEKTKKTRTANKRSCYKKAQCDKL
ncbi:MAG: hypothetical protein EOL95_08380 [Bacteroidia bacterium]|nr:hypothetical protein [Bacteroidia bacterium]